MALSKKLFYRKPPDHLLEIAERVYVFDCCFSTDILQGDEYVKCIDGIVVQLLEKFPEFSFMVFNFGDGNECKIFTRYSMKVMDFPIQYEKCALLPLKMISQFLQSCNNWLSLNEQQNVLLMHCEKGGWPLLAFMLASLMLYRKQITGEKKILEMMYKQASKELLQFLFPVNSQPSQLRYLHYISWKTLSDNWPISGTIVEIDSIMVKFLPVFREGKVCQPVVRIYGKDPSQNVQGNSKLLLSTAQTIVNPMQADCNLVKIDIHCSVEGDVVLECVHLDEDQVHEKMMFRAMFHTSFLRSNILVLGRDEIDVLWDAKDNFSRDFKVEVLFLDADSFVHVQTTEMTSEGSKDNGFASPKIDKNSSAKNSIKAEGSGKEVCTEEVDYHTFLQSNSNDVTQRLNGVIQPYAVKNNGIDIMNGNHDKGKDIILDQWDNKADPSSAIVDMNKNKKSKNADEEVSVKSEKTWNTLRVNVGHTAKLELKVQEQKESSDVGGRKVDKILTPRLKKPPTFFTKAVVITAGGKQKGKQQELSTTQVKSPTNEKPAVSRWIPSNKGSYTNSMHVAYPPTRSISIPPSLGAVAVPKKTNFLRKGGGAKKSASHTDLTSVRVSHGSLDSPTARFVRTPPSPLPHDEPRRMSAKARPRSPLVSPSSAYRIGVPPLPSRTTASSNEDTKDSCSSCLPPLTLPNPNHQLSTLSLQLIQSSKCALPPHSPSLPPLFQYETNCQEKTNCLPPPSPSPSSLNEKSAGRRVQSPQTPLAPPSKFGYSCTSPIKNSNDRSVPPPPPLPPKTATIPERNNPGECNAISTAPFHGMPPDYIANIAADLLKHEMSPQPIPLSSANLTTSLASGGLSHSLRPSSVALPPSLSVEPPGLSLPLSMSRVPPPPPPPSVTGVSHPHHLSAGVPSPPKSPVPRSSPRPINALCLPSSRLSNAVPTPPPNPMSRIPPPPFHPVSKVLPSPPTISGVPPPPPHLMSGVPPPPPHPGSGGKLPPPPPMNGGMLPPPNRSGTGMPPPPPSLHGVVPPPPMGAKGTGLGALSFGRASSFSRATSVNKSLLKPLHWSKVTRALKGSLWEELQTNGETHIAHEFDVSEIETLFSAVVQKTEKGGDKKKPAGSKVEKVTLIDLRRANNTEIMLSKVKMPLPDIMMAVLALDESVLDIDQVENLIKFCPTKEEMDLLKAYTGDNEKLGKCEQYFLELMKVPRVESKLRVFAFKIQFDAQTTDFKKCLNTVNAACEEVRNSEKLKDIMKRILFLGNTLNNGTARGSAVGFKLESLLKLYDTRSSNSKMTLMHYLCKVIASKSPSLIDFYNDLGNLEAASKIQLKSLAEEMQAISRGLEKVKVELGASENDGPVSETFRKTVTEFVSSAVTEVAYVTELYSAVGENANALALYFGEDPARYPFEQVCATIANFVRLFQKAHEENLKEAEQEKKKLEKEAEAETSKSNRSKK